MKRASFFIAILFLAFARSAVAMPINFTAMVIDQGDLGPNDELGGDDDMPNGNERLQRDVTELSAPSPNPMREGTNIELTVSETQSQVTVSLFDVRGRSVGRLADGALSAGRHVLTWNGTDEEGVRVPAGVYFVRLESGVSVQTRKVVVSY